MPEYLCYVAILNLYIFSLFLSLFLCPENVSFLLLLDIFKYMPGQTWFFHRHKHYEPDWTAHQREQSDLSPYCLQHRLPKNISRREKQTTYVVTGGLRVKSWYIFSVQRADELMAEVDSARAKARNAVDLGERTLIEANDTLTTLLGKLRSTVKPLYNVILYNRIFTIRHKFAGNGSISIKTLFITEYSLNDTDSKLWEQRTFSIENIFIITEFLRCVSQFGDQDIVFSWKGFCHIW